MPSNMLTCGIALCTCNGMAYLQQQLDSLLLQQRLPDQIAIYDDASDDGTSALLQDWAEKAPVPVILHRNLMRQGVVKNFELAVQALRTDLVFLCDQDDVWLPHKIAAIAKEFESAPDVLLVHTDARLVDADANELGVSLLRALELTRSERDRIRRGDAFSALCRRNLVTGATAAFRRSLLDAALPFPLSCLHDEWLGVMAAATGRVVLLERPTILYRQHSRNVAGMPPPDARRKLRRIGSLSGDFQSRRAAHACALLERLQMLPGISRRKLDLVKDALTHARLRSTLPSGLLARIGVVLREAHSGRYRRFSNGFAGVLRDILNR